MLTVRDKKEIKNLYWFHRYKPAAIARLFAISRFYVSYIVKEDAGMSVAADIECLLCTNEDAMPFYIDGNEDNTNPQNVIMLCEADKRRLQHRQITKKVRDIKSES